MATLQDYLDYAELAQAAYGNLSVGTPSVTELVNGEAEFSSEQASIFSERYEVRAVADSFATGLDAILLYDQNGDSQNGDRLLYDKIFHF